METITLDTYHLRYSVLGVFHESYEIAGSQRAAVETCLERIAEEFNARALVYRADRVEA